MMPETFKLTILNPIETLMESERTKWVHVRLANGTGLSIYPGHAPLLAETVSSPIRYADEGGEHRFNAEAGILQVGRDGVTFFISSESEPATAPGASTMPEERRFQRLARELRARLKEESDSTLGRMLSTGHEST